MSDPKPWSDELLPLVKAHIEKKWKTQTCPMCGTNTWAANGYVVLSVVPFPGPMILGGPVLPNVALVCQNCGNTILINLIVVGIYPTQQPPHG